MRKYLSNTSIQSLVAAALAVFLLQVLGDSFNSSATGLMGSFYGVVMGLKVLFLQLLKMLIAPLIFFSLLGGLFQIGNITKLKQLGGFTLTYYIGTTVIAILIGLTAVFFIHPWENSSNRVDVSQLSGGDSSYEFVAPRKYIDEKQGSGSQIVLKLIQKSFVNPISALSENNILGIVMSALLLGLSALFALKEGHIIGRFTVEVNQVLHFFLGYIIKLMPIGIFAIVMDLASKLSADIFGQLLSFCLLVFAATAVHSLVVLPLIARIFANVGYFELFRKISKPMIVAFSTSSSSATLPVSMETCEKEFGVSKTVSGFVFPLGATMNMDGTALFEGIAAVFLAYIFGVELGTAGVFAIFFMAMISSVGAPGMPSGSMSGMQMVLLAAGIPLEAIGILLVVERPLDTFRTAVNVQGDVIGAVVTQRYLDKSST
ncbi:MAG: dicarboxylate/amino acid:cation symporter [Bdellovibrionales bacterium]